MANLIESLESRVLFSASSALVLTLHTDEKTAKADLATLNKDGKAAEKTLKADLKAQSVTAAASQYKALSVSLSGIIKADTKALSAATNKVNSDVNKLDSAEAGLARNPSSVTLTAKVTADKAALTSDAATDLTAIQTANNGVAVESALSTIIADGGTAGTDASTAMTTLGTDASAFGAAATAAFSTDVAAIVAT